MAELTRIVRLELYVNFRSTSRCQVGGDLDDRSAPDAVDDAVVNAMATAFFRIQQVGFELCFFTHFSRDA